MGEKYWITGIVFSAVAHVVLLSLLAIGSSDRQQEPETKEPIQEKSVVKEDDLPSFPLDEVPDQVSAPDEYVVQQGDTLIAIARRVGCSAARLAEVNKSDVRKLSRLRVGQRLILPERTTASEPVADMGMKVAD